MTDSDLLGDLVWRVVQLKLSLGSDAYREAVYRAAMAVARVALAEAEERARAPGSNVVAFRPRGKDESQ
ncbi:hypothetical protein GJ654_20355 [Rhodoblastus acidophilus]|uniref:Uncharacterized protein n=1 Tax=Rhodoblastus acidophilus TaxID=1074 RepID=A0A6N8DRT4_RHOAC|nr:hypothetical protein [Rhodoblastus acidophilus]MCW2276531.1 hypothetical protein [Rhodoblastus acidophilus]MTV33332.1 hypothetical protein [Rhodoblastus acidophilus]